MEYEGAKIECVDPRPTFDETEETCEERRVVRYEEWDEGHRREGHLRLLPSRSCRTQLMLDPVQLDLSAKLRRQ